MRKQTKIAAVVSAAALLALGASITSFAGAKGTWMMGNDGEWYCYDKNGEPYTETFCTQNGKDYYVGEDGAMVTSSWVDYGEGVYYVGSNGIKTTNNWRLLTPFEDEDADEEWFFFQGSGKRAENKKITWKNNTYFFDSDGKMLTGWVTYDPENSDQSVDEAVGEVDKVTTYYCDETGARVVSDWVKTYAPEDIDNNDADEHWYYMKSNGRPAFGRMSNVKGQSYFFNEDAEMLDGWVGRVSTNTNARKQYVELGDSDALSDEEFIEVYYCCTSDGHMKKNKWVKDYAPNEPDEEDENKNWYWIKKNGVVFVATTSDADPKNVGYANTFKFEEGKLNMEEKDLFVAKLNVNGKYYYFNKDGEMLSGFAKLKNKLYYFGGADDGSMKTGSQNIKDDTDETYRFFFATRDDASNGETKGEAYNKDKSGKLYHNGMLIKATDYKYEIVKSNGKYYIVNQNGSIQTSAKKYMEDGVTVIDASNVKFDGKRIAKIGNTEIKKNTDHDADVVKLIEQGSLVDAKAVVGTAVDEAVKPTETDAK